MRVTVVTPTWKRHDSLFEHCIPSVLSQDYSDVEHIVVSDGPDPVLQKRIENIEAPSLHYAEMDKNYGAWGAAARRHAAALATGDVIAYLDDDDAFRWNHISEAVKALTSDVGYTYSMVHIHSLITSLDLIVGASDPLPGRFTTSGIVHRKNLLDIATWQDDGPFVITACAEWALVSGWREAGIKWAFIPKITVDGYPVKRQHERISYGPKPE